MDKCFNSFLSGTFEKSCLQLLLSKALGYGIVALSFTLKVPQIKNMLKSKTDKGLSYIAIYSEILIFLLNALYGFHNKSPFSVYGENIIILAQTIIILLLSWRYSEKEGNILLRLSILVGMVAFAVAGVLDMFPQKVWLLIGSSTIPLISSARLSQIWTSFKTKNTGPLSPFTFLLTLAGNSARAFTIITEAFDWLLIFTCAYAFTLNFIVLMQIYMYRNKSPKVKPQ